MDIGASRFLASRSFGRMIRAASSKYGAVRFEPEAAAEFFGQRGFANGILVEDEAVRFILELELRKYSDR